MNTTTENFYKSNVSKWIAGFYLVTILFLIILTIAIPLFTPMTTLEKSVFIIMFIIITLIIASILLKAYKLRFTIGSEKVTISGLMKQEDILVSDITDIKKIPIPFGFRLYGASFLGGRYYMPGIGKVSVAMSNFKDGVLITTKKDQNFLITPSNPMDFVEKLKRKKI